MRTLPRLLATSLLSSVFTVPYAIAGTPEAPRALAPAAPAAPASEVAIGPQIHLVQLSAEPRPGGGQRIHYTILERITPLLAVRQGGTAVSATVVTSSDAVGVSYEQVPDGWLELGTLTVDQYGPHGPAAAAGASAAASAPGEPAPAEPLALAIAPVRPDPVRGGALVVDVALRSAGPARLEVLDIQGRRVAASELGSLGAGRHTVDLGPRNLSPGIYLLRLTQDGESRVARVTLID